MSIVHMFTYVQHTDNGHDHIYTPQAIGLESCHGQSMCERTRLQSHYGDDINIAKIKKSTPGRLSLYYAGKVGSCNNTLGNRGHP